MRFPAREHSPGPATTVLHGRVQGHLRLLLLLPLAPMYGLTAILLHQTMEPGIRSPLAPEQDIMSGGMTDMTVTAQKRWMSLLLQRTETGH